MSVPRAVIVQGARWHRPSRSVPLARTSSTLAAKISTAVCPVRTAARPMSKEARFALFADVAPQITSKGTSVSVLGSSERGKKLPTLAYAWKVTIHRSRLKSNKLRRKTWTVFQFWRLFVSSMNSSTSSIVVRVSLPVTLILCVRVWAAITTKLKKNACVRVFQRSLKIFVMLSARMYLWKRTSREKDKFDWSEEVWWKHLTRMNSAMPSSWMDSPVTKMNAWLCRPKISMARLSRPQKLPKIS